MTKLEELKTLVLESTHARLYRRSDLSSPPDYMEVTDLILAAVAEAETQIAERDATLSALASVKSHLKEACKHFSRWCELDGERYQVVEMSMTAVRGLLKGI